MGRSPGGSYLPYHTSYRPVKSELALCPEEVDMVLELELEDIVFSNVVALAGDVHAVSEEGEAGQGEIVLKCLVEV